MPLALSDFDIWRPGYAGKTVNIFEAGTTTLATIYSDYLLTTTLTNPQVLDSYTDAQGNTYGRWQQPVYTDEAVELDIDGERSGRLNPTLQSLADEDASNAQSKSRLGTRLRRLQDRFADFIQVEDYGELGTSATTNTTTISAAIGKAASDGGGLVLLPPGEITFNQLTLPTGVVLRGAGKEVTTLISQFQGKVITLNGDRSGLQALTLDGVDKQTGSIGIYSVGHKLITMHEVQIENIETGMYFKGLERADFRELELYNMVDGVKFHGDLDTLDTATGTRCSDNHWIGGRIEFCSDIGLDLFYEDAVCEQNVFRFVGFKDNTTAIQVQSARFSRFECSWFEANTTNVDVSDGSDAGDPEVEGMFISGRMDSGTCKFDDTSRDMVFQDCNLTGVTFDLTLPKFDIVLRDCIEDQNVTITGTDTTKLHREASTFRGSTVGQTTGSAATKAWSVELNPGELCFARAWIMGNRRDGDEQAWYSREVGAQRGVATLDYDSQTANFTVGQTLTGGTSGATGLIVADSDSGTTGTLSLRNIVLGSNGDTFLNNEAISDGSGGAAVADGVPSSPAVALAGAVISHFTAEDVAGWDATFAANGSELEVQVTGAASSTIDWTVHVELVRNG